MSAQRQTPLLIRTMSPQFAFDDDIVYIFGQPDEYEKLFQPNNFFVHINMIDLLKWVDMFFEVVI